MFLFSHVLQYSLLNSYFLRSMIFWLNLELHAVEKLDVELTRQKYTKREVFAGLRKQLTYFQGQIVHLQAVQVDTHWSGFTHGQKEKGCSLLLVLLDGAQNNMMREVLYSLTTEILLALPTSSFIFQSCSTYYASETFLILKKIKSHCGVLECFLPQSQEWQSHREDIFDI